MIAIYFFEIRKYNGFYVEKSGWLVSKTFSVFLLNFSFDASSFTHITTSIEPRILSMLQQNSHAEWIGFLKGIEREKKERNTIRTHEKFTYHGFHPPQYLLFSPRYNTALL